MDDNEILLLMQDDKRLLSLKDTEPQVNAEAIAAFAVNNQVRVESLNLPLLAAAMFPSITMVGTNPIITVNTELTIAVRQGTYPATETHVLKYIYSGPSQTPEPRHASS